MNTFDRIAAACVKALMLSAFITLGFGTFEFAIGTKAFAQGLPPGTIPTDYGSKAFRAQTYRDKMIMSEVMDRIRHSRNVSRHKAAAADDR